MPKVAIIPLSICQDVSLQRAVDSFVALGVSRLSILWNWPRLNALFNRYRKGEFSTAEFRTEIGRIFPNAVANPNSFDHAWNSQCVVTDYTREIFKEARELERKGVEVYFLSGTNELHYQSLRQQCRNQLPKNLVLSFNEKLLEKDLRDKLFSDIKDKHPKIKPTDIALFYKTPQPAYPWWLGPFAWFFYTIAKLDYNGGTRYVRNLVREANDPACPFTLVHVPAHSAEFNFTLKHALEAHRKLEWKIERPLTKQQTKRKVDKNDIEFSPNNSSDDDFSSDPEITTSWNVRRKKSTTTSSSSNDSSLQPTGTRTNKSKKN